jgi:hypothetical protein
MPRVANSHFGFGIPKFQTDWIAVNIAGNNIPNTAANQQMDTSIVGNISDETNNDLDWQLTDALPCNRSSEYVSWKNANYPNTRRMARTDWQDS